MSKKCFRSWVRLISSYLISIYRQLAARTTFVLSSFWHWKHEILAGNPRHDTGLKCWWGWWVSLIILKCLRTSILSNRAKMGLHPAVYTRNVKAIVPFFCCLAPHDDNNIQFRLFQPCCVAPVAFKRKSTHPTLPNGSNRSASSAASLQKSRSALQL